uniref:Uncharacterized protein n=1 Tax=Anguilla anguilla TaxID=7936 RepID=A0A0E9QAQ1_ANGAN
MVGFLISRLLYLGANSLLFLSMLHPNMTRVLSQSNYNLTASSGFLACSWCRHEYFCKPDNG